MQALQRLMTIARYLLILTLLMQGRSVAEDKAPLGSIKTTMHAFFQALTRVFPWSLDAQQFQDTQFTGSSGLHVPQAVEEHLEELRRLRGGS